MLSRCVCILLLALAGFHGFSELGLTHERVLVGRSDRASSSPGGTSEHSLPSLTAQSAAAGVHAIESVARLAAKAADARAGLAAADIAGIARAYASVSIIDALKPLADALPDEAWKPRLIHGLEPSARWRELRMVSVDLEGGDSPHQIGLVHVSRRESSHELKLEIVDRNGNVSSKADERRLLDASKPTSEADSFEDVQEFFEPFVRGRVPVAYNHQGDLQALLKEWSALENPGSAGLYVVEPGIEWIDVEDWSRILNYGDENKLKRSYMRATGKQLFRAHDGVNDARATSELLFTLAELNPEMPATYGDLIKYQIAWRENRGVLQALADERLEKTVAADIEELTAVYQREYQATLAKQQQ